MEDNLSDIRQTQRAFKNLPVDIEVVMDGEKALARLLNQSITPPDIILLDLNLPRVSGWDVLRKIKATEVVRRIPIIILSSSKAEEDILRAHDQHCNNYIIKPATPERLRETANILNDYWFGTAELPHKINP